MSLSARLIDDERDSERGQAILKRSLIDWDICARMIQ